MYSTQWFFIILTRRHGVRQTFLLSITLLKKRKIKSPSLHCANESPTNIADKNFFSEKKIFLSTATVEGDNPTRLMFFYISTLIYSI